MLHFEMDHAPRGLPVEADHAARVSYDDYATSRTPAIIFMNRELDLSRHCLKRNDVLCVKGKGRC